jgi:DNA-directed RNA polymerase specialized sigma24 family protein
MTTSDSFVDVIARLRRSDEDAAAEIFSRFARRLIGLARRRLEGWCRGKIDPEDVLQSAMGSFFVRNARVQFELRDWDSLWSLLVQITLRKCGRRIEAITAKRRDARREVGPRVSDEESCLQWEAIAPEPTPEEAASLIETMERLLLALDDPELQQIARWKLEGLTDEEIAGRTGRVVRTIERKTKLIRQKWEAMQRWDELPR